MGDMFSLLRGQLTLARHSQVPAPSEDALWLAACLTPQPGATLLEAGSGSGAATLAVARRSPNALFWAMEKDAHATDNLETNTRKNDLSSCVFPLRGDILHPPFPHHSFDHCFANPPFHLKERGFSSKIKQTAHGTSKEEAQNWLATLLTLTRPGGTVTLLHHAANLPFLLEGVKGDCHITLLESKKGIPPKRAILQIHKNENGGRKTTTLSTYAPAPRRRALEEGLPLGI